MQRYVRWVCLACSRASRTAIGTKLGLFRCAKAKVSASMRTQKDLIALIRLAYVPSSARSGAPFGGVATFDLMRAAKKRSAASSTVAIVRRKFWPPPERARSARSRPRLSVRSTRRQARLDRPLTAGESAHSFGTVNQQPCLVQPCGGSRSQQIIHREPYRAPRQGMQLSSWSGF